MNEREQKGRGLFYNRDSGGKHEMTPSQYVQWALRKSAELGITFHGTAAAMETMIREGQFREGDLFLDYGVSGSQLSRPGLDALIATGMRDLSVSHILIPRRDRLARPENPLDGVRIEDSLRQAGLSLVYMDKTLPPIKRGARRDMSELIVSVFDYDASGMFRRELAQKMVFTQTALAEAGYSVGGRPPYGFDRWLVDGSGQIDRRLDAGETVRRHGYHVVWLPAADDDPRMQIIQRILTMLETTPAARVARILTEEGVPSPDAGRRRKDQGVDHRVSGVWHQTTIVNIARNPLLLAVMSYGRRGMGDQLRYSSSGPRELEDSDRREDGRAKVVQNPESQQIRADAKFAPIVEPEHHQKLLAIIDDRSGTQRGKSRSRQPAKNPLGTRVYDMACGWPMYRTPYNGSFRYTCGLYQQSHAAQCSHNHVDGVVASRFVLATIRQRLFRQSFANKLEQRLRECAERELMSAPSPKDTGRTETALAELRHQLERVTQNLAFAEGEEQHKAVAGVFNSLKQREATLEAEQTALRRKSTANRGDIETEIARAMKTLRRLPELAKDPENLASIGQLFEAVNARMYCQFEKTQPKKRVINKLSSGVVTFGNATPPIELYEGPTDRRHVQEQTPPGTSPGSRKAPRRGRSDKEGMSLGNVNRDDRI